MIRQTSEIPGRYMASEMLQHAPATSTDISFFTYVLTPQDTLQLIAEPNKFESSLKGEEKKGLVIYSHPGAMLEAALANRENYDKYIEAWIKEARPVLNIIRKLRGRIAVFEETTPQDKEALSAFQTAFDNLPPPPQLTARFTSGSTTLQAVASLLACQNAEASRYIAELQASSLAPPAELVSMPDVHILLKELEQQDADTQELSSLREFREDAELIRAHLLEQITDLQTGFERTEIEKSELKNRLSALQEKQEVQHAKAERDIDELKKQIENVTRQRELISHQLNLAYASTSWRVSAPLRAIARLFKR